MSQDATHAEVMLGTIAASYNHEVEANANMEKKQQRKKCLLCLSMCHWGTTYLTFIHLLISSMDIHQLSNIYKT